MTIGLRSFGNGFDVIAAKLQRLADKGEDRIAERGAEAAQKRLDEQFARTEEPSGLRWKPKKRPNGKPTLEESGDMKGSAKAVPGPNGDILLYVSDEKAAWHQEGTEKMIARKMLPEDELPPRWREPIDEAAHDAIHEVWDEG